MSTDMTQTPWSRYVTRYADFGDARLKTRLVTIVEALVTHPTLSLPEAMGTDRDLDAYYAFLGNRRITAAKLLQVAQDDVRARLREDQLILAIHDTSEFNYHTRPKTRGLGPLSNPRVQGLHVHSALAVTAHGLPLGPLYLECWARAAEKVGSPRHRALADKESARWLRGMAAIDALVSTPVVHIADREADIYDLFLAPRPAQHELLIRVQYDPSVPRRRVRMSTPPPPRPPNSVGNTSPCNAIRISRVGWPKCTCR